MKEQAVIQTVEDGKSAFEAGKAFGEWLLQTTVKTLSSAPFGMKPKPAPKP